MWESGTEGYLGVFSGAGYTWDRGLGFSPEAAPSWDANVLFRMDKAGPGCARTGTKRKTRTGGLLDIMAKDPIYYRRLYIVIDKQ